jgi:hypothetical protein
MAIGIAACPALARARAGTGALARIAPVGGNLPFGRHRQGAADFLLDASSDWGTLSAAKIRSPLCRNRNAKLSRYSAMNRSVL